jgi:hypothetical protein
MSGTANLGSDQVIFYEVGDKLYDSWDLKEVCKDIHVWLILSQYDIVFLSFNKLNPFRVNFGDGECVDCVSQHKHIVAHVIGIFVDLKLELSLVLHDDGMDG